MEIPSRAFGGRLAQQLLRLLALRRGTLVPKDIIAEALWPDGRPADADANIEVLVSRVRRALGDRTLIQTGVGGYALAGHGRCQVDAEEFRAAAEAGRQKLTTAPATALASFRSALRLWRGEPLAEDTYAAWAQDDRQLLAQAYLAALEGAASAALAVGDPAGAVSLAGLATAREPLRESSAMLLVHGLAASGDQVGALTTFDAFRRRLAEETGLDPSPGAQALRQRVLVSQLPATRTPQARAARAPGGPGKFVAREAERCLLTAAATGAGPRMVEITGPAAVGKSRLLAEAARCSPVPVLSTRAVPGDRDDPWALAGRLLRQAHQLACSAGASQAIRSVLAVREADALAEFIPCLAPTAAAQRRGSGGSRALATQAAIHLMAAVARPRCLLLIDDLSWADRDSLDLISLLLRHTDCIAVAAAYRLDAAEPGWSAAEALGVPAAETRFIALEPLPPGVIRDLLADSLLAELIREQVSGTPFGVTEILAALARQGRLRWDDDGLGSLDPPGDTDMVRAAVTAAARDALTARLAGSPPEHRQLACLLAVLGRAAPPTVLADASEASLGDVLAGLEALARTGLATHESAGWTLRDPRLSTTIAGTLSSAERARAHGVLAQALQRAGADPAEVAAHLRDSGDRAAAAARYAAAACRQLARNQDAQVIALAEAGLALQPSGHARGRLLEARAEVHRRRGRLACAGRDLAAALDAMDEPADQSRVLAKLAVLEARSVALARGDQLIGLAIAAAADRPDALGQALMAGAIIDLPAGRRTQARNRFRRAQQILEHAGDSLGAARQAYWQAMVSYVDGQLRTAATQLGHLADLPVVPAELARFWSPRATRGHVLAFLGEAEAGLTEIDEALGAAQSAGYPALESECLWRRSEALAFLGRAGEAIETAQQAAVIAAHIGHASCLAGALRGLGIGWQAAGRPDRAVVAFRHCLRAAEGNNFFAAWAAARLGACLARQGCLTEAAEHVHAAMASGTPLTRYEARWAHAELLAARGDGQAGRAAAAGALRAAERGGYLIIVPRLRQLMAS